MRFAAASAQRWFTPLRIIGGLGMLFLAGGFLTKASCLSPVNFEHKKYLAACYTDVIPLFSARGLGLGDPYSGSHPVEYPVLTGYFQAATGWFARLTAPVAESTWFLLITCVLLAAVWMLTLRMVFRLGSFSQAITVACSPLILIHAFTNWDILPIAAATAALLLARRRPALAGVAIGVGAALKLWPIFLLGANLVIAYRRRRYTHFFRMALATAVTVVAVNLPALLTDAGWWEFLRLNGSRGPEWTTLYATIGRIFGMNIPVELINGLSLGLFTAACVFIGVLGATVQKTPRAVELLTLILVAFLLFNKVWSPQYSLWLVIPAVLALPGRKGLLIAWMCLEVVLWPVLLYYLGPDPGAPAWLLNIAVLVRDAAVLCVGFSVVRQMLTSESSEDGVLFKGCLTQRPSCQIRPDLAEPYQPRP